MVFLQVFKGKKITLLNGSYLNYSLNRDKCLRIRD
jgi:hypothetical protein